MRNNRRFIIHILLFLFLCCYSLDRVTMAVAGSTVAKEMGLSPVALGYLFSSYLWLYAVVLLPAGALTDRLGARRASALAATFWSICQALGGFATSAFTLLLTRLGLGLFESAANPCAHSAIREWTPRSERGFATAIWYAGTTAGPALGSPMVAWLIATYGWRWAFIATGALGLVWVAVWALFYRSPEEASWITEEERAKVLSERDVASADDDARSIGYRGLLLTTPTMWGLALTQGCINYTAYFFLAWLPGFLQASYGLSVIETGAYTAVPFGLSAVLGIGLSAVADRMLSERALREGKRRYAVAIGALMSAFILLTPYVGSIGLAMVVLTVSLTFNTFAQSMNFALTNDRLRTSGDVGRAYAFFTLGGISFGIAGPIVTGYLVGMTGNFKVALLLCGVLSFLGAALVVLMTRRPMGEEVAGVAQPA
ncbi:MFS transporter [Ancylobacter mangrovi]|uniref:MFS transporter n=1 Tax=Ancylobacter mangrovi TaxID=2972472 RepID=A0A9X2PH74_9HYPH|nr:MFS transporter [Ancylobacter mangrovi]MCS0494458.1 MFS transporter [Ancylobacter mangrovi]MCS0500836.1 MFS transporter [Ancylobacter mangrovi]